MDAELLHRHAAKPDPRRTAEHLLNVVPRLLRVISAEAASRDAAGSLTVTQLSVLAAVKRGRRLPSEIARDLKITPATASGVVDLLVRRGLVERGEHPGDRRRTPLRLTTRGAAHLGAAHERSVEALKRLLAHLEPADLAGLEWGLDRFLRAFGDEMAADLSALSGVEQPSPRPP